MKLKEWVKQTKVTATGLAQDCSVSRNAMNRYINGIDVPALEVALLICRESGGKVLPHELLVDEKRRRSEPGDPIVNLKTTKNGSLDDLL